MKRNVVEYDPMYFPYIYSREEIDATIISIIRQLIPLWKRGRAYGCICPENITFIQKDHLLYGELDLQTTFMNPEFACPETDRTPASDIFSLGILFHEMLTEEPPHYKGNQESVSDALRAGGKVEVSDLLDDVHYNLICAMIEYDPRDRIGFRELLMSLEAGKYSRRYRRDHDGNAYVNVELQDEEGSPVSGARISIMHILPKEQFFQTVTDEQGEAQMMISSGESWITIMADGYAPFEKNFFIFAEEKITFSIRLPKRMEETGKTYSLSDEDFPF